MPFINPSTAQTFENNKVYDFTILGVEERTSKKGNNYNVIVVKQLGIKKDV